MKRKNNLLLLSLLISALIHVLFVGSAYYLWVPGVSGEPTVINKLFKVQGVREMESLKSETLRNQSGQEMSFIDQSKTITETAAKPNLAESIQFESEQDIRLNADKSIMLEEVKKLAPKAEKIDTLLKEDVQIQKRSVNPSEVTIKINTEVSQPAAILESDADFFIPDNFLESMHAFTPGSAQGATEKAAGTLLKTLESEIIASDKKVTTDYAALDSFLDVEVLTYRDPKDGQNYFRLSMIPSGKAQSIAPLNKEVVFLVDASLSIHKHRLHAFKKGLKFALSQLNPSDLFNIYVFKNKIIPFHSESIRSTPAIINAAEDFLDNIEADRRTDIYSAFLETMQTEPTLHPSYIVLLSDGNANTGISSTAKLIAEITRTGNQQRPIFSFSGGGRVNHFLLDFLAYPNRGWSEYARNNSEIDESFRKFIMKIKNPILTDIRYQISGTKNSEVFPKNLPDFYRDAVFTIYGKYDEGEKFSFRIYGKSDLTKREFIVSEEFAKMPQGDESIAKSWAFNKVYYLISQLTLNGPNPADQAEIERLIKTFDLEIPYEIDQFIHQ